MVADAAGRQIQLRTEAVWRLLAFPLQAADDTQAACLLSLALAASKAEDRIWETSDLVQIAASLATHVKLWQSPIGMEHMRSFSELAAAKLGEHMCGEDAVYIDSWILTRVSLGQMQLPLEKHAFLWLASRSSLCPPGQLVCMDHLREVLSSVLRSSKQTKPEQVQVGINPGSPEVSLSSTLVEQGTDAVHFILTHPVVAELSSQLS